MIKFIWVIGNMGSGKSTLTSKLKNYFPNFIHFNIDEYRKTYNTDNSMDGENEARNKFFEGLADAEYILLESIGTYGAELERHYLPEETMKIHLHCSKETFIDRVNKRIETKSFVPFPYLKDDERTLENYVKSWEHWGNTYKTLHKCEFAFNTDNTSTEEIIKTITEGINTVKELKETQAKIENNLDQIHNNYKKVTSLKKDIEALTARIRDLNLSTVTLKDENEDLSGKIRKITGQ